MKGSEMLAKLRMKLAPAFLVTLIGSLPISISAGAETGVPSSNGGTPDLNMGTGLESFYTVLKILFFLAIIIGIFFVLIRLLAKRNQLAGLGRPVRSLGGVPLGPNKSVQILAIGKAIYIVGVGDNVQLLEKIDDEETVAELNELMSGGNHTVPEFMTIGKWLKRIKHRSMPIEEEELETSEFGQVLQEKLREIATSKKRTQQMLEHEQNEDRFEPK